MAEKINIALYWAASCGGCEVAVLDVDEQILELASVANIVLWPVATDFKYKDIEAMDDRGIDITLFNGAIRNSENEHMAKLLRRKSRIMVAFGSCAAFGGVPGLSNITDRERTFKTVYSDTDSTVNPGLVTPQTSSEFKGNELSLPEFYDTVLALDDVVDVDLTVPGCPPTTNLINKLIDALVSYVREGKPLPEKGTVIASEKTLCEECPLEKSPKLNIEKIYRPHEIIPEKGKCFLGQGIICTGPATRGGCEARCIKANMPCRGCMGPTAGVLDQGASMLSAVASIMNLSEDDVERDDKEIEEMMSQVIDPLGLFYRFTLPKGQIKRGVRERMIVEELNE